VLVTPSTPRGKGAGHWCLFLFPCRRLEILSSKTGCVPVAVDVDARVPGPGWGREPDDFSFFFFLLFLERSCRVFCPSLFSVCLEIPPVGASLVVASTCNAVTVLGFFGFIEPVLPFFYFSGFSSYFLCVCHLLCPGPDARQGHDEGNEFMLACYAPCCQERGLGVVLVSGFRSLFFLVDSEVLFPSGLLSIFFPLFCFRRDETRQPSD